MPTAPSLIVTPHSRTFWTTSSAWALRAGPGRFPDQTGAASAFCFRRPPSWTQLRRANRGDVTAGSCADHHNIELVRHAAPLALTAHTATAWQAPLRARYAHHMACRPLALTAHPLRRGESTGRLRGPKGVKQRLPVRVIAFVLDAQDVPSDVEDGEDTQSVWTDRTRAGKRDTPPASP
jgi:hypothetical protein